MPQKLVRVIIPALNEEKTIGLVIDEIPVKILEDMGYEVSIVVIDNNCTDRTALVARERGATVVSELRRGKGRAITTAFELAGGDFIFILDGDYTYPGTHIPEMVSLLESGFDVVLGSRLKGKIEKGAMARTNLVGNHLLTLLANKLYRTKISDLCTGYWGFRGETVKGIRLDAQGFDLEANFIAQISGLRCRIAEVPVNYRRRPTPSKLNGFKDGFRIVRTLVGTKLNRTVVK